jgi:transcriptional regulator of heat shock response
VAQVPSTSQVGRVPSFYHYDFTAQALSKLSRGYDRDTADIQAMYEKKLFSLEELRNCFESIESELIRYPSLKPDLLRNKIEEFIAHCESKSEDDHGT